MSQAVSAPKPDFNVRHRDWQLMVPRWRMAWCFLRGGAHVLEPDYTVYSGRWPDFRRVAGDDSPTTGVSEEQAKPRSDFDIPRRVGAHVRSFLWRHDTESPEEFGDRARRLYHYGLFRSIVNIYVAGILKSQPKRPEVTGAWERMHENLDSDGTNVGTFMRRALTLALTWGRVHAICDREKTDMVPMSAADADMAPLPYCCLVSPIDIVDWRRDRTGFVWVVYREDAPDERQPGFDQEAPLNQYRVLTRTTSELWRETEAQQITGGQTAFEKIDERTHNLGRVPISTLWATEEERERVMACETPFADALDFNRHILNKLSEANETERTQSFSLLAWPIREGGAKAELHLGPLRAAGYDADVGVPSYVSPDSSIPDGLWKRTEAGIQMVRTLEGASRGRAEYSKEERSAASITVENQDKINRMTWWAAAVEEFDADLHKLAALWLGEDAPKPAVYNKEFDFRATSAQVADVVQLASLQLPRKVTMELAKHPALAILRENGADAETLKTVSAELDKAGKEEPKPRTPPSGAAVKGYNGRSGMGAEDMPVGGDV